MNQTISIEESLENAIRFLVPKFPDARELIKPTAFHSIRVGTYLYENWYSEAICLAGLLHDIIEDTNVTKEELKEKYWEEVYDLVMANTKNMDIADKEERNRDMINRCSQSEEALIIKCTDIMDNYKYRTRHWNMKEIERARIFAKMIKDTIPPSFDDKIFWDFFTLVLG